MLTKYTDACNCPQSMALIEKVFHLEELIKEMNLGHDKDLSGEILDDGSLVLYPVEAAKYKMAMKECRWKTVEVNGPPDDGELVLCKYDMGVNGYDYRINYHVNGNWFSQKGVDDKKPNYYKRNIQTHINE